MMKPAYRIALILQLILNVGLLLLAIILIAFLTKETIYLGKALFNFSHSESAYLLIDGIVIYFLYFEFLAQLGVREP